LSGQKVRPAVCLSEPLGSYKHVVLAFITSLVPSTLESSDIRLLPTNPQFEQTGLRVPSTIRLHRVIAVTKRLILRELGILPVDLQSVVQDQLRKIFSL
jgi:mRNA interferase MazF